jgi:hypothetical protein
MIKNMVVTTRIKTYSGNQSLSLQNECKHLLLSIESGNLEGKGNIGNLEGKGIIWNFDFLKCLLNVLSFKIMHVIEFLIHYFRRN